MADNEFDLARGEYLLAGGISGIFEPGEQFLFVHPFFQLVTGALGSAVRKIKHGQFLQAVRAYLEITHEIYLVDVNVSNKSKGCNLLRKSMHAIPAKVASFF
nr:MAG TPA: hypothetical protein [Caudoviricetes sp.]